MQVDEAGVCVLDEPVQIWIVQSEVLFVTARPGQFDAVTLDADPSVIVEVQRSQPVNSLDLPADPVIH